MLARRASAAHSAHHRQLRRCGRRAASADRGRHRARDRARGGASHFSLAVIHAEQADKDRGLNEARPAACRPLRNVSPLDEATIDRASRIVGMMGAEPLQRALDEGADVVLGRPLQSDPAPWAGCRDRADMPPAPSWYAGKMLECGATPSIPKGHDCLLVGVSSRRRRARTDEPDPPLHAVLGRQSQPARECDPLLPYRAGRIAGHLRLRIRGGERARGARLAACAGSQQPYTVKLEGAELAGYRAITICGTRDPMLVGRFDAFLEPVRENVADKAGGFGAARGSVPPGDPHLWRQRRDGGMGAGEAHARARARLRGGGRSPTHRRSPTPCWRSRACSCCTSIFPDGSARKATWRFRFRRRTSRLRRLYRF